MITLPASGLNCRYLYKWFKQNCWECQFAHGECYRTAKFVELVFGLKTKTCSYHAWNVMPDNFVLDLTVGQFGFNHYDKLVAPSTVFDVTDNGQMTYLQNDNQRITMKSDAKDYLNKAYVWLCVFDKQLNNGKIDIDNFQLTKPELNKRVVNGFNRLSRLLS